MMIAGRNAVIELLKSGRCIDKLYVKKGELEGSAKLIVSEAAARGIPVIETERSGLDRLSGGSLHQGVVAVAAAKEYVGIDDILQIAKKRNEVPFVVILDGIEDPYNLGAIIRTAECAGVHGVIIPKRRSALLSSTVEKASAGALEYMAVAKVSNLTFAVDELKKPVFGFMLRKLTDRRYIKLICAVLPHLSSEVREEEFLRFCVQNVILWFLLI